MYFFRFPPSAKGLYGSVTTFDILRHLRKEFDMVCRKRDDMSRKMLVLLLRIETAIAVAITSERCLTYSELAKAVGGHNPRSRYIAECLGTLQDEDRAAGSPLRSALVVRKDTGIPGSGFFDYAGVKEDDIEFWRGQLRALGLRHVTTKL